MEGWVLGREGAQQEWTAVEVSSGSTFSLWEFSSVMWRLGVIIELQNPGGRQP